MRLETNLALISALTMAYDSNPGISLGLREAVQPKEPTEGDIERLNAAKEKRERKATKRRNLQENT